MTTWKFSLFILMCLLLTGCAALLSKQEYVQINQTVSKKYVFSGVEYSIPERADVRKIVILGTGKVQNFDVYFRNEKHEWKFVKEIQRAIEFPFEIMLVAETDAIKIAQRSTVGRGRIDTIQIYTVVEKKVNKTLE